jgi:hypothetical protein
MTAPTDRARAEGDAELHGGRASQVIPSGRHDDRIGPRTPTKAEMRQGGMVATAVLVFLAIFTIVIVWIA